MTGDEPAVARDDPVTAALLDEWRLHRTLERRALHAERRARGEHEGAEERWRCRLNELARIKRAFVAYHGREFGDDEIDRLAQASRGDEAGGEDERG